MVLYLHPHSRGTLAQMVEQWTENPCVPGSIPGGTTKPTQTSGFFVFIPFYKIYPNHSLLQPTCLNVVHPQYYQLIDSHLNKFYYQSFIIFSIKIKVL